MLTCFSTASQTADFYMTTLILFDKWDSCLMFCIWKENLFQQRSKDLENLSQRASKLFWWHSTFIRHFHFNIYNTYIQYRCVKALCLLVITSRDPRPLTKYISNLNLCFNCLTDLFVQSETHQNQMYWMDSQHFSAAVCTLESFIVALLYSGGFLYTKQLPDLCSDNSCRTVCQQRLNFNAPPCLRATCSASHGQCVALESTG